MSANRLGDFLRAHREGVRFSGERHSQRRRTPGLRREEVAARADVSTDYYTRLEQGRERRPSPHVLDALADALELSAAEASYLHSLVELRNSPPVNRYVTTPNEFLLSAMQSWTSGPAYIVNHRTDVLAANDLALAMFENFQIADNILRMLFLDPAAKHLWVDWDVFAQLFVGGIRRLLGSAVDDDPATVALIAEVSAKSAAFAALWERQEIYVPDQKSKTIRDAERGEIRLDFELLSAHDTPNQALVLHRSAAGS